MTTYGQLQDKIARELSDDDHTLFTLPVVKDMLSAAIAEVGAVVPERFQEDITPTDSSSYALRADAFGGVSPDDIELKAVEVWTVSPLRAFRQVEPGASHPDGLSYSQAGWFVWNGTLLLPDRVMNYIDPVKHLIRVWGYSPWRSLTSDDDVAPFGNAVEEAVVLVCRIEALRRIINNRSLFTQWQTRSNNTDASMASLMSDFNIALQDWRHKASGLYVIREAP